MSPLPRDFKIRRARLEDLSQIVQLEKRVWKDFSASKAEIKRRFLQFPQGIRVALVGHLVVGCCQGALFESVPDPECLNESFPPEHVASGKHLFLFGLTVNPHFRRLRIASALVASENRPMSLGMRFSGRVEALESALDQGVSGVATAGSNGARSDARFIRPPSNP